MPGDGPAVLILSHDFWRKSFNSNPAVIGQPALVAGRSYRIIGVAAPGFQSKFGAVDVWMPLHPSAQGEGQGLNYEIVSRLRSGSSWEEADAEVASLGQAMLKNHGGGAGWTVRPGLENLQQSLADELRTPLILIFSGAVLVLVIGCVNVAAMLLARGVARRGEVAIRTALGASRSTIVRQLIVENLAFGIAASLTGLVMSYVGVATLHHLPEQVSGIGEAGWTMLKSAQLDWRTVAATIAVSFAATLLFGLFPAFEAGDAGLSSAGAGRGTIGGYRTLLRRALPALQVAIAVFLLVGAGLLGRSFAHLWTRNPGFDSTNVVSASFSLRDSRYAQPGRTLRLFEDSIRLIHEIPGVESVAVAASLPYERALNEVFVKSTEPMDRTSWKLSNVIYVSPEFFQAFRIPLLRGRVPEEPDSAEAPHIMVINEAFAKKYYPQEDPLGVQIKMEDQAWQIVGIVGDTQQRAGWGQYGPMGAVPCIYVPAAQFNTRGGVPKWIVRTHAPDATLQRRIERIVKSLDPAIPLTAFRTVDEVKRAAFGWQEFLAAAMGIAAFLALLLSVVGMYAMISNAVAERTREFGIRMALGATVSQTIGGAARPGLVCAGIGLLAGIGAARFESKVLVRLLWGITPTDFLTFFAVAAGVTTVAMLASVIPALRISRLDPAQTLRQE